MSCFYGLEGGVVKWTPDDKRFEKFPITCYPKIGEAYGGDAMKLHGDEWKAHITMGYQDVWVMNPNMVKDAKPWIPCIPIDYDPCPPPILSIVNLANRIISVSRFGHKMLSDKGYFSYYIPNGVDTSIFKPMDTWEMRKNFGLDKIGVTQKSYIFGMVAANKDMPPRKSFQKVLDAFLKFKQNHPREDVFIFFHSLLKFPGGFDVIKYAKFLGIDKFVLNLTPYDLLIRLKPKDVAQLMNTFDCLLAPSTNEGFGLPIIEAQACGKPVVVNDFTSMPELIIEGKTGLKTKIGDKRFCPVGSYIAEPDLLSLYDNLEKVYKLNKEEVKKDAVAHIATNYDMDMIYNSYWRPFLEDVQEDFTEKG